MRVTDVSAWEALDSRGRPTVAARLVIDDARVGRTVVPSGASTGQYEARELRDGGVRMHGLGVRRAVDNVRTILAPRLIDREFASQEHFDEELAAIDDSFGFEKLGSNAVLALSLAFFRAGADEGRIGAAEGSVLPMPMINILSGGAHAGGALDIQDVLVIPIGARTAGEAFDWVSEVRSACADLAGREGMSTSLVADEGGFGLGLHTNRAALELVTRAIAVAGFGTTEVKLAIDVAATQFHRDGQYRLGLESQGLSASEWRRELLSWVDEYPIVSIEDPFTDDDWEAWREFSAEAPAGLQIIGDDLFATNPERVARGIECSAANCVLVKPNQIGTLSAARTVVEMAAARGWNTVTSARSGDTEDHWLVDLAISWNSPQIKVGSLTRSERTAKWNRMLELEARFGLELARWKDEI